MHAALLKLGYETGMQGHSCEKVQYEGEVLCNEPLYPAFYGVVVTIQLQQLHSHFHLRNMNTTVYE